MRFIDEGTSCRVDRSMYMAPIRSYGSIWQQSVLTRRLADQLKHRNDLAVLNALRTVLQKSEYEAMLTRWHNGELELRIKDGMIITCYTPAGRDGSRKS
jgi:hypothetical protein